MGGSTENSRPGGNDGLNPFPYGILALTIFAVLVTATDYALAFKGPIGLRERIIPFTGWSPSAPYAFMIFFAVYYCLKRERKLLYVIAYMLLVNLCFGVIDALRPAHEDFGNPWLMVSRWRPLWTIALPALWLTVVLYRLKSTHLAPSASGNERAGVDQSKQFLGKYSDARIMSVMGIIIVCACGFYIWATDFFAPPYKPHAHLESLARIGQEAPAFAVSTVDGAEVSLKNLKGKVTLINFWATWCGPCLAEMPRLEEEVWRKFKSSEFTLLAIANEQSDQEVSAFRRERGLSFPMAADPEGRVFQLFASEGIPRSYVVGADGTIVYESVGYDSREFDKMKRVIEQELNNAQTN